MRTKTELKQCECVTDKAETMKRIAIVPELTDKDQEMASLSGIDAEAMAWAAVRVGKLVCHECLGVVDSDAVLAQVGDGEVPTLDDPKTHIPAWCFAAVAQEQPGKSGLAEARDAPQGRRG
jgi:hypothetical protein